MEFEARMIDETDFHGIRRLLQQVRVQKLLYANRDYGIGCPRVGLSILCKISPCSQKELSTQEGELGSGSQAGCVVVTSSN